MSAHKLHVQWWDVSSFHFYHRTLNQACSAAKSPNASLQCAWNSLLWNCGFFWCILLYFVRLWCRGLVVSQMRARKDAASAPGMLWHFGPSWGAQGRTQCPLTWAKHCNLCFLGHSGLFGLPVPTVMVAAMCTLIFVFFLSSILLCATWSAVTCPAHWINTGLCLPFTEDKKGFELFKLNVFCSMVIDETASYYIKYSQFLLKASGALLKTWCLRMERTRDASRVPSFSSCSPAELCGQKDGFFQAWF